MSAPEPRPLVPRPDPPPGLSRLHRRLADRTDLRDGLLAAMAEHRARGGATLGSRLDVAGDPTVQTVAELWSRVADSIAAYTELTAGERYLGTAQDWSDLRRTTDLLGHRPAQRAASRGWVRFLTDPRTSPLVPAGIRVQAPGTPTEDAQTFETIADTQLRADWATLTATAVPKPGAPPARSLRMLTDPGWSTGDRVLLIAERRSSGFVSMPTAWSQWLRWPILISTVGTETRTVRGIVRITKREEELGAFLMTTDRELGALLPQADATTYAAYLVRATLALAQRLKKVSYVSPNGTAATARVSYKPEPAAVTDRILLVTDASAVTPGVRIVVWDSSSAHVTSVSGVDALSWSVAPGTMKQVGRITLATALPSPLVNSNVQIALVDDRVVAQHYDLPPLEPGITQLRVHPRPAVVPERLAVHTSAGWELATCTLDAADTSADAGGMILALGTGLAGGATTAEGATSEATANLVRVRHGETMSGPLTVDGSTTVVAGPVAADVTPSGDVTNSLRVRVGGVAFEEVDSLYARRPGERVFTTRLVADGRLVVEFGDGVVGALPRGEVTARWRIGGGLAGEIDSTRIDAMLGSVKGVRKVAGVGVTTGAADQEEPRRMRQAASARIRTLDRAVSAGDLADLALTIPGTSHATSWRGQGPPGCNCGRIGLHLAFMRLTATGVRPPMAAELRSLNGYLDARRDSTVPLCVAGGIASSVPLTVAITADPARDPIAVQAEVEAALTDPAGPLAPQPRGLGVPLDASDVVSVVHSVPGVVGVVTLTLGHGLRSAASGEAAIGRTPAARYEVVSVGTVTVVIA